MGIKETAEKINNDIQNRQTSTTVLLRDARTLGKLIKTRDFEWVEKELAGYTSGKDALPTYRNVNAIESKTWLLHLDTSLQRIYSDWLKETKWMKWLLTQSVTELEDLLITGYKVNTGIIIKSLGVTEAKQTPIYQLVNVSGQEIKKVLDQIQDKLQDQVGEILANPEVSKPSTGIFLIFLDILPDAKDDFERVSAFLESGQDYLLAARSCRPILHAIIRALIPSPIPKNYKFSDGVSVSNSGEKSKIKYFLEQKGDSLFSDKTKILFIDEIFRELYDVVSKADKNKVNIYEANYCVDKLLVFLEKLHRYTDLKPI